MILLLNKKAKFDYDIQKEFLAGIVLSGPEVKSLRLKSGSLKGSFVKIINGEAFLLNAQITPYKFADNREYDPKRTRKLLLRKKEVYQLAEIQNQKGMTLVPLSFELDNKKIKLKIGVGKGRKQYQKKEVLKQRDLKRDLDKSIKDRVKLR